MYGLEKKPGEKFAFDLEKKIKDKPTHAKELIAHAESKMAHIKKQLREGSNEKEFDQLGILLHGYAALQKVLKKVTK
jgi:hypothetical protein